MGLMPVPQEALVITAKYPQAGKVKSRLARHIGDEAAARLCLGFIGDLEEKFGNRNRPLFWAYTPADSDFPSLVRSPYFPQEGADLGERLLEIFRRLIAVGFRRVCVMGSDLPHMPPEWIDRAFAALSGADCALTPAQDGGYTLMGLKEPHDLFSGIPMGTSGVLAATLARAKALGLSVHLLPAIFDVDDLKDLENLRRFFDTAEGGLRRTRANLQRIFRT